jgi:hypothetical protein
MAELSGYGAETRDEKDRRESLERARARENPPPPSKNSTKGDR